jgi:two-component system sensor histidine kinase YcbA
MVMSVVDAISNSLEAILRNDLNVKLIQIVIVAGLLRAVIAFILFTLWKQQSLFIQKQEHQKRYVQLTSLAADVETELFYLRKSADQIESVMRQSYKLYDDLPADIPTKNGALEIAREIHEIKKDYLRVLSGFEDFIRKLENIEELSLSEILAIVKSSSEKSIAQSGKRIRLSVQQDGDVMVKEYLNIFTLLNNLIDNSIFASSAQGAIHVGAKVTHDAMHLSVSDEGSGIDSGLLDVIFNPGFTTKYNAHTGKASTGIGLSHVQNLVEEMNGDISVTSEKNKGAQFKITLPLEDTVHDWEETQ